MLENELHREENMKLQLIKDAHTYLEGRIKFVDTKASFFMAVLGGFFAIIALSAKEMLLSVGAKSVSPTIEIGFYLLMIVTFLLVIITVCCLLQTIRPTRKFLHMTMEVKHTSGKAQHVMWPSKEGGWPQDPTDFEKRIQSLDTNGILANYEETLYVSLQLIRNVYNRYRVAALLMKFTVVVSGSLFFALLILKLIGV